MASAEKKKRKIKGSHGEREAAVMIKMGGLGGKGEEGGEGQFKT